jgi:hypothetical protein
MKNKEADRQTENRVKKRKEKRNKNARKLKE